MTTGSATTTKRGCDVPGCPEPHSGRGWCNRHYQRWLKYGDPEITRARPDLLDRFWVKVNKNGPVPAYRSDLGPCWIWTGALASGYGTFRTPDPVNRRGRLVRAHRFAYELVVGPIPDGLELDHLCRVRACVNPAHGEPVTHAENVRRCPHMYEPSQMALIGDFQRAKTHCPQQHPYDESNTSIDRNGHRHCRACARERWHRRKGVVAA